MAWEEVVKNDVYVHAHHKELNHVDSYFICLLDREELLNSFLLFCKRRNCTKKEAISKSPLLNVIRLDIVKYFEAASKDIRSLLPCDSSPDLSFLCREG